MARKNDHPKSVSFTILLALAVGIVGGAVVWPTMRPFADNARMVAGAALPKGVAVVAW